MLFIVIILFDFFDFFYFFYFYCYCSFSFSGLAGVYTLCGIRRHRHPFGQTFILPLFRQRHAEKHSGYFIDFFLFFSFLFFSFLFFSLVLNFILIFRFSLANFSLSDLLLVKMSCSFYSKFLHIKFTE